MGRGLTRTALAAVALVLALTGCGSGNEENPVASANGGGHSAGTAPAGNPQEMAVKFAQCLRRHGVPVEDPKPGQGLSINGGDKAQLDKAREACREFQPQGASQGQNKLQQNMLKHAQCMRENGVDSFPDPKNGALSPDDKTMADPDFKKAQSVCSKIMSGAGPAQ